MKSLWNSLGRVAITLALLLGFAAAAHAQLPVGSIAGSVSDASGAMVPGANVTATNRDRKSTRLNSSH